MAGELRELRCRHCGKRARNRITKTWPFKLDDGRLRGWFVPKRVKGIRQPNGRRFYLAECPRCMLRELRKSVEPAKAAAG